MSVNMLEGKYVTDFHDNTAERCSYGLEISRTFIRNEHILYSQCLQKFIPTTAAVQQVPNAWS